MDDIAKWRQRKKHFFLFSNAGKPIYSRYACDESKIAGVTGVLVGIISFVGRVNDTIKSIQAGKHKIVFVLIGPIYCVTVAESTESITQLATQLEYMYSQIISTLTFSWTDKILKEKPGFDLRNLLTGTDKYLNNLASNLNCGAPFLLNAVNCLRIPGQTRNTIGSVMHMGREGDLFYALLVARGQLVHLVRPKKHILYPPDLHLLINFITESSGFRNSEAALTPICLPKFNNQGFLHLYVCYLDNDNDICLLLISLKAEDFYLMSSCKDKIKAGLETQSCLSLIDKAVKQHNYSVSEVGIPDLLHFLYKTHGLSQMTQPQTGPPYHTKSQRKRLFRLYQQVHDNCYLDKDKPHKVYYHRSESETIVAWITNAFDLYACFSPLVSKAEAIKGVNNLLKWINKEEHNLFITNATVW